MSVEEVDRYQDRSKRARRRHRQKYWAEHDRSEYECPVCGRGESEVYRFEVHHIDEDPMNGDMDNLVALCRECHFEKHGRDVPKTLDDWKNEFLDLSE